MADMAAHVGIPTELKALGKTWHASRLTRKVWRDFGRFARQVLPDPLDVGHRHIVRLAREEYHLTTILRILGTAEEKRTDADRAILRAETELGTTLDPSVITHLITTNQNEQKHCATIAQDKAGAYLSFASTEFNSVLQSMEGQTHLLWLRLRDKQPDVTEDDAYNIIEELGPDLIREDEAKAGGVLPADPKDAAPTPAPASPI